MKQCVPVMTTRWGWKSGNESQWGLCLHRQCACQGLCHQVGCWTHPECLSILLSCFLLFFSFKAFGNNNISPSSPILCCSLCFAPCELYLTKLDHDSLVPGGFWLTRFPSARLCPMHWMQNLRVILYFSLTVLNTMSTVNDLINAHSQINNSYLINAPSEVFSLY